MTERRLGADPRGQPDQSTSGSTAGPRWRMMTSDDFDQIERAAHEDGRPALVTAALGTN